MKPLVLKYKNAILIILGLIILIAFIGISTELLVSNIIIEGKSILVSAFSG